MSVEVSIVLQMKYSTANANNKDSSAPLLNQLASPRAASKALAHTSMAIDAMAGVPILLVQRFEVRHDPTKPSRAAASTAGAAPYKSSTRKMKISPPAREVFAPGIRTGNRPTIAAV